MIELSQAEQQLAKYLAKLRNEKSRTRKTENKRIGPQDDFTTDLEGIGAELAFCKMFNLYPDLECKAGDYDAMDHEGNRVDVKATKYKNGHLLAVPWKKGKEPDVYVLLVGEFPSYRCAGFMRADELISDARLKDLGHGKVYAAAQSELTPAP